MKDIRISDDALEDLADGCDFYDAQEAGVGEYFISCLRSDIQRLDLPQVSIPESMGTTIVL